MDWRRSNGVLPQRKGTKICNLFSKPGGCRFGANCKYLHTNESKPSHQHHNVPTTNVTPTSGRAGNNDTRDTRRDGLIQWRYNVPLNTFRVQPLGSRLSLFIRQALDLVETDTGVMQEVILALTSEGGFVRLKELLDQKFGLMSDVDGFQTVSTQLVPFFKIITHSNVASSIMLEDKIGSIYNFLYGRQGERGVEIFTLFARVLASSDQSVIRSVDVLEPILVVFSSMIDINSHALVNEQLPPLAELLFEICKTLDDTSALQLRKLTTKIGRRLKVAHTIHDADYQLNAPRVQKQATFVLRQDFPGLLSCNGPRHDNDHAHIKDIAILPTFAEIKAARAPYLPSCDAAELHLSGIEGLLDRHFRLLREDTVGQLRDAISAELEHGQTTRKNAARVHTYDNLVIMDVAFSRWKALQLMVQFDQPQHLRKSSVQVRKEWWEYGNRLKLEALVCIIGQQDSVTFCTVSELTHASGAKPDSTKDDPGKNYNTWSNANHCYLQLQLVTPDNLTISKLLRQLNTMTSHQRLVEFPGVLLPSFQPTLEALKKMTQRNELPFAEYLAPDENPTFRRDSLDPPLYATRPGFQFELAAVMKDQSSFKLAIGQKFDFEKFKIKCQLDEAQANALVDCLGRSLALIQGPPGTGKSFTGIALIKVLLGVKQQAKLGPILCVCYTNHALDQLLEHLVRHGVTQIIRMGSRSKSEILEKCNLRTVAQNMVMTGPEKKERWEVAQQLQAEEQQIEELLATLTKPNTRETIKTYLELHNSSHYDQLFADDNDRVDEDGFQTVHHGRGDEIQDWLRGGHREDVENHHVRPIGVLNNVQLSDMNQQERRLLYFHWLADVKQILQERLVIAIDSHRTKKARLDRVRHGQDLRCLEQANIIGVTTTGLARQLDLLQNLRSKVLICEEAGEVLEAHIMTALLPSLEHAILIGDHLQLPPHIQNYDLSRENSRGEQYSLDLSLFERLVTPGNLRHALPFSILKTQRRMHPSISELIRSTLYPQLKDSTHVEDYPGVAGMKRRLFWLDHRQPEAGSDSSQLVTTSHSNDFEIRILVALVTHLVRQGVYAANEIAVLTPYLGQLHKIRKVLRNQFEITMNERDVQEMERNGIEDDSDSHTLPKTPVAKTSLLKALAVSTIDNFQGEEAQVVLISLVRSNNQNKCGFLRTSNRINVLLSRAKHGMYIIGNSETSGHVKMWADVIRMLQHNDNFGPQLELECPRHPDTPILVSKPDDFVVFSPEGGCSKRCDKRLECGHRDQSKCHSETLHRAVKCLEPCPRQLKGCDHGCPKLCGDSCVTHCQVKLIHLTVELACGHVKTTLPCWQHQTPSAVRCQSVTNKIIPGCKHQLDLDCCLDVNSTNFKCTAVCGAILPCGHSCRKPCNQCNVRRDDSVVFQDHGKCLQVCGRDFNSCSHYCKLECHGVLPCKCNAACENFCEHSRCGKRCDEPCAPCASTTCATDTCPHTTASCTMPCSAPCDWLPCAKRCEKALVCGHQCPTVCGEICPSPQYCQTCADQDIKNLVANLIMMTTYGDTDLDEDPCVIPSCGHILTISSMDGQMEMSKQYTMNDNIVTGIRDNSKPFSMDELKVCATCRGSLRNVARYGRIVRRALLDESTKKFIRWAGLQTLSLTEEFHKEQQKMINSLKEVRQKELNQGKEIKLDGSRIQQLNVVYREGGKRYKGMRVVQNKVSELLQKVQVEEQPYKRVWDLVQHAKRKAENVGHMTFQTGVLHTRGTVQVTALLLRCDMTILADFFASSLKTEFKVDLSVNRASCAELVHIALEANQPLHAVEGHMFFAQYCAAERPYTDVTKIDSLIDNARRNIAAAREICKQHPVSTQSVTGELDDVENMLRNSTFYAPMRDNEWKVVMAAMSVELRGSGHWYTCANGHPFTIGECGMAMEQARCPQCDAPIGGQNHQAAAGVRHAADLEQRFGQLRL